jgi:hypothetical protein
MEFLPHLSFTFPRTATCYRVIIKFSYENDAYTREQRGNYIIRAYEQDGRHLYAVLGWMEIANVTELSKINSFVANAYYNEYLNLYKN